MDPNHGQSRSTFRTLSDKLFNSYLLYSTRESYSEKKIQSERFCAAIRATVTKDFDAKSQNIVLPWTIETKMLRVVRLHLTHYITATEVLVRIIAQTAPMAGFESHILMDQKGTVGMILYSSVLQRSHTTSLL